ncbi:MAG TPA: S8 family serine peptidase, partial [Burkholderiaceae bacterium]|nr:S8 family serine peptidase [Burkholderiaceae bacterium]
ELRGQSHGTSLSAPAVAATAALLIQANPGISFEGVKAWLQAHAIDTPAPRQAEGAGMLDLPGAAAQAVA